MNITFFIDNMSMGGAQRVVSVLSSEFVSKGHSVTILIREGHYGVAYVTDPKVKVVKLQAEITELTPVKLPFWHIRKFFAAHSDTFAEINAYYAEAERALTYFQNNKSDVIVAFLLDTNIAAALCTKKVSTQIIVAERNFPDCFIPSHIRFLRNFAYKKADVCVFQTKDQATAFPRSVQKKGVVIPNPIKEDLPEPFVGKRNNVIINHCGYKPQKNTALLIDAFAKVLKKHPDYRLEIYGYGNLKEKLQEQINLLDISEKVRLLPFEKDIHKLLLPCAMFVMSSDYEGMPNALMEAMGIGLPVISTDCKGGGARALIRNHENGIITPIGDAVALADAMNFYIEHPEKAQEYAKKALEIKKTLAVKDIAEKWLLLCRCK